MAKPDHKHSIVGIEDLKSLYFKLTDLAPVLLVLIFSLVLAEHLGSQVVLPVIATCATVVLMSLYKIYNFRRMHKKIPEKINMYNLHDEVIEFLDYCTGINETRKVLEHWTPEKVEYIATKIKEELRYARELIDKVPPGPDADAPYINAIKNETNAIYATWTTEPAMWRDPMFIYYMTMMGIKNLIECQNQNVGKKASFSRDPKEITEFFREGIDILDKLAKNEDISRFFVLRFLILPREDYTTHIAHIDSILRIHHQFRMHCIPLVEEELLRRLSEDDKSHINSLGTMMYNNNRLDDWQLSASCIDFLLVGGTIWWYKGVEGVESDSYHCNDALHIIRILSNKYEVAKLPGYNEDMIKEVTIFS